MPLVPLLLLLLLLLELWGGAPCPPPPPLLLPLLPAGELPAPPSLLRAALLLLRAALLLLLPSLLFPGRRGATSLPVRLQHCGCEGHWAWVGMGVRPVHDAEGGRRNPNNKWDASYACESALNALAD